MRENRLSDRGKELYKLRKEKSSEVLQIVNKIMDIDMLWIKVLKKIKIICDSFELLKI